MASLWDAQLGTQALLLVNEILALDNTWTTRLAQGEGLPEDEPKELADVGSRMADALNELRDGPYMAVVSRLAEQPAGAEGISSRPLRELVSKKFLNDLRSITRTDNLRALAEKGIQRFEALVGNEVDDLRGRAFRLSQGGTASADITPQMRCALYAMGIVISFALGWWPSLVALAITFTCEDCVSQLRMEP